jgi:hypothetical protein
MSDALTAVSRAFFERAKMKMVLSLTLGAGFLLLLGFTAAAGGESASANHMKESADNGNADGKFGEILGY